MGYLLRALCASRRLGSRNKACCTQSLARGTGACWTYSRTRRSTSLMIGSPRAPEMLGSSPADMQASLEGKHMQWDQMLNKSGFAKLQSPERCWPLSLQTLLVSAFKCGADNSLNAEGQRALCLLC